MNALTIIFLVGLVALAWLLFKKTAVRVCQPVPLPPTRGETDAKSKLPARL